MWIYDLATSALSLDGTIVGEAAACTLAPGEYTLAPITDWSAGVPVAGVDGAFIAPGAALDVPEDVVARVIASKVAALAVIDSAAPIEAQPEAEADPA